MRSVDLIDGILSLSTPSQYSYCLGYLAHRLQKRGNVLYYEDFVEAIYEAKRQSIRSKKPSIKSSLPSPQKKILDSRLSNATHKIGKENRS